MDQSNGITWMLMQIDKKEFEQPESDPVAWAAAQAEYTLALVNLRRACKRPRTHVERAGDPDAD